MGLKKTSVPNLLAQAIQAHSIGDLSLAKKSYKAALKWDPLCLPALTWLATLEAQSKHFKSAEALYERALSISEGDADLCMNYGNLLFETGRPDRAKDFFERAVRTAPTSIALANLALCCSELREHELSLKYAEMATCLDPNFSDGWCYRGDALASMGRHNEALESYEISTQINPSETRTWINAGVTLSKLHRYRDALLRFDRAIALCDGSAEAWNNRGTALNELGRHHEALISYDRAISLDPNYHEAWNNRGVSLGEMQRDDEALASHNKAIALRGDFADAYYQKALLELKNKNFLDGFLNYSWRWRAKNFTSPFLNTKLPLCESLRKNDRLLLWAEQGIGDEVFYAGQLEQLSLNCKELTLAADPRLHPIYRRSFPSVRLLDRSSSLESALEEGFDCHAPIGDIGRLLKIDPTRLQTSAYLKPNAEKARNIRTNLNSGRAKTLCGLSWRSANQDIGAWKSIELTDLQPLFQSPQLNFVSLQYGPVDTEVAETSLATGYQVLVPDDLDVFNDIDGLLALIEACDVVVTTSNVTAHLAGAIGKPAAVLVPLSRGKIWYWHSSDRRSIWYPSINLFFQTSLGDWSGPIEQARDWLLNQSNQTS